MNFNYAAMGRRIKKARKEKGLTQEQLAELCDLSTAHIGHVERGSRALSIETLVKFRNQHRLHTIRYNSR